MAESSLRIHRPLFALLLAIAAATVRADIFWDNCESPADHPGQYTGDFYNLCIRDHLFEGENWSWKFTKAEISDTVFDKCTFTNQASSPNNFTLASWNNVEFNDCKFGSVDQYGPQIVFDRTAMNNVVFSNCEFDHSIDLVFSEFAFNNVTFDNCVFRGDTLFTLGQINTASIIDSRARHSDVATTRSGNDSFSFRLMTINDLVTTGSHFITPVRFEGVNGRDITFNDTISNIFTCHSAPDPEGNYLYRSSFNDSSFNEVRFHDQFLCDQTVFRGLLMTNVTFLEYADFSGSAITDIYWDGISQNTTTGDCHELNFTSTRVENKVFANVTIDCVANFEASSFEQVFVRNFFARRPIFKDAVFSGQEYIDSQCCSTACVPLGCLCNVTETSGNCPIGARSVNLTASNTFDCFPARSTLSLADGRTRAMHQLRLDDEVHVGEGEHSPIFFFGHRDRFAVSKFMRIEHDGESSPLRVSPGHYVYVDNALAPASAARVGSRLRGAHGRPLVVTGVSTEWAQGLYAPTSLHGDLAVDGVIVSSYTQAVHPGVAHTLLHPLRALYRLGLQRLVAQFRLFEQRSWSPLARDLGLPLGPSLLPM